MAHIERTNEKYQRGIAKTREREELSLEDYMTAPPRTLQERLPYKAEKPCCSVCDRKKVCHVCGDRTLFACSNCAINFGATVYVCAKSTCRDEHESKCFGDGQSAVSQLLAEAREALEETTAEAIEHRKNIIECHSGDFQPVPDPRYKAAMQKEIARFDALIERARAVHAKLKAANGEG